MTIPVFAADSFAHSVAQAVSANSEGQSVTIRFSSDVKGQPVRPLSAVEIGQQAVTFTLSGRGQLVWNIDVAALAQALAGRSETVFQGVIKGFPAVEEARARITPFWKHAFPKDAATIKVTVEEPSREL